MNGQLFGQPEFTDYYFRRKLRWRDILGIINATKLKLLQENPFENCI